MKMFIPTVGTTFRLTDPWYFSLFHEYRNEKMLEYLKIPVDYNYRYGEKAISPVILSINSILKVDRIYIRKGNSAYDSLSFTLWDTSGKKPKTVARFWAKLDDVNNIEFELVEL